MASVLYARIETTTHAATRSIAKIARLPLAMTVDAILAHSAGLEHPLWPAVEQATERFKDGER